MTRALSAIRNPHAVVRLVRKAPFKRWPQLSEPIFPSDTDARMRAQSLLAGMEFADGTRNPDTLTLAQSHDVLRWATTRIR
jgi:hypothetical protein